MSSDTLEIRRDHLNAQLGEDSPDAELAILDPAGKALPFYGVFDDNAIQGNKDSGNVFQKVKKPRIIVSELPYPKDQMEGQDVSLPYRVTADKNIWNINYIQTDAEGAQILWLI